MKSKTKIQTPKPESPKGSTKTKRLSYLSGELEVEFDDIEVDSPDGVFETPNFLVDADGGCFMGSSLTVRIAGRDRVVTLNARETHYVLQLLRLV